MAMAACWHGVAEGAIAEEVEVIEQQVHELVDPLLDCATPMDSISRAFDEGRLDVPFAASRFARSAVVPCRDPDGAIRFAHYGNLPFSPRVRRRNDQRLRGAAPGLTFTKQLTRDISYFADEECPLHRFMAPWARRRPRGPNAAQLSPP